MLEIQQYICPVNQFTRPNIKLNAVKGIVLHWTATNSAPAMNIAKYFAHTAPASGTYASAHFSVDDNNIVQSIPENEMAYSVGSNTYTQEALNRLSSYPNNCTISIEMCIDANGNITESTFKNAADLTAYLLKKYNLTLNDIWTHRGIVGWKDCPRPWMTYSNGKPIGENAEFDRFKGMVAQKMNGKPEFVVFQWKTKLKEFSDHNAAYQYAKQWDHSYIVRISNNEWVWSSPDWTKEQLGSLNEENKPAPVPTPPQQPIKKQSKHFNDIPDHMEWIIDAADRNFERGLIIGSDGKLNPTANLSRGEMTVIVDRIISRLENKK